MSRYYVHTLGCKLNQADTARAEGLLRAHDYVATDDPQQADVILLNTCTVTSRADAEGRRLARRLRRMAPEARIVVTGCYAERDPETLRQLGHPDAVIGLAERERLAGALLGAQNRSATLRRSPWDGRTRAYLRVQEGCDLKCSYCVIPAVRGPSRSTPAAELRVEARALAAQGVREIGLTGTNIGAWGRDLAPRRQFADLLEELLTEDLPARIRIGSLEPRTVTRRVLDLMAAAPERLAPHMQVPLQSGADRILARMGRNHRTSLYRNVVEQAAARVPDICIGTDVIAGFPGESAADHAATIELLRILPLGRVHVFAYSPRPNTRAAALPGRTPPAVTRARTAQLRALGADIERAFRQRMAGRRQLALALDEVAGDGSRRALTGNYIEVLLPPGAARSGELVFVRLTKLEGRGAIGRAEVAER